MIKKSSSFLSWCTYEFRLLEHCSITGIKLSVLGGEEWSFSNSSLWVKTAGKHQWCAGDRAPHPAVPFTEGARWVYFKHTCTRLSSINGFALLKWKDLLVCVWVNVTIVMVQEDQVVSLLESPWHHLERDASRELTKCLPQ